MTAVLHGELGLQLLKLLISVAVVIGLSLIAERLSTRMAGLLSGYPLGTAITLGFIGVEISPNSPVRVPSTRWPDSPRPSPWGSATGYAGVPRGCAASSTVLWVACWAGWRPA
ncbi:hypothetical protein ACU8V3_16690 [Cobetia marina]